MIDLRPSARLLGALVGRTPTAALGAPTPYGTDVGVLLHHVDGLATGLAATARKEPAPAPASDTLRPDFRDAVPAALLALAQAWDDEAAWQGRTSAGGVALGGEEGGLVTADELVVHAWDLAVATGQEVDPDPDAVEGALAWVRGLRATTGTAAVEGLFGAVVPVDDDAPALHRLLGLTGRDPRWRP